MKEKAGQIGVTQRDRSVGCGRRIEADKPGRVPHIGRLCGPASLGATPLWRQRLIRFQRAEISSQLVAGTNETEFFTDIAAMGFDRFGGDV